MSYNFKNVEWMKKWAVNKILPVVYDDSLSYYEVLCKLCKAMNDLIANEQAQNNAITDLNQRATAIENRFDNVEQNVERLQNFQERAEQDLETIFNYLAGGTNGQVFTKTGNEDYEFQWLDPAKELPEGGTEGQVLTIGASGLIWKTFSTETGLPVGGTSGQIIVKQSETDYDVEWETPRTVPTDGTESQVLTVTNDGYGWRNAPTGTIPAGGLRGYVLAKNSAEDGDVAWNPPAQAVNGLPEGGTTGQMLVKETNADYEAEWVDVPTPESPIPEGGTEGQILVKGNDGLEWADNEADNGVPEGGTTGQFLKKSSGDDYDSEWASIKEVPADGTEGQVITKGSGNTYSWSNLPTIPTVIQTSINLGTNWTNAGSYFTQQVNISQILASDTPIVDIITTTNNFKDEQTNWGKVFKAVAQQGNILFYASGATTRQLTVSVKVVR